MTGQSTDTAEVAAAERVLSPLANWHYRPFGDSPQHRLPARKQTLQTANWTRHVVLANPVIRPSARSLEPGFTLASNGQDKDRIDV